MKNRYVVPLLLVSVTFAFARCKKDNAGPRMPPPAVKGYNTTDTSISLNAGRLTLDIPAGALKTGTTVTTAASKAKFADSGAVIDQFQLLPEGTVFRKPVMLVVHYDAAWLRGNSPFATGIAFLDEKDGKWYAPINGQVDTVHKTISIPITHFSQWSVYNCYHMEMTYEDQQSVDDAELITMPASASAVLRCYRVGPPPATTKQDVDDGDIDLIAPLVVDPVSKGTGLDTRDCRDCDLIAPLAPDDSGPEDFKSVTPDTWYVNGMQNGDARYGTISKGDQTSTYHSPSEQPADNLVAVTAGIRIPGKEISLIQAVKISGGLRWTIRLTTTVETQDPVSIHSFTTVGATFFIHSDGKTYNTGEEAAQLLFLDSVHVDAPVTSVTINNFDQYTSYKVSYKLPSYSWLPGLIGVYYTKKKVFNLGLQLTGLNDTRVASYCFTPHNGSGGGCVTDTGDPPMLSPLQRENLSTRDGYTETYVHDVDEQMGVATISKLIVQSLP